MNIDGNITPWFVIGTAITYLVQLILAYGVYYEAERIKRVEQKLWFVGSFFWFLVTLFTGVLAVAVFWLIHFSMLKETKPLGLSKKSGEKDALAANVDVT